VNRAVVAGAAYVGTVVAANVMTDRLGLVPIGFGLMVTAGTFAAGASLIARDWVQQTARSQWVVPALIVAAALVSAVTANPALALASGVAFLVSEAVDWRVFTPLRSRSLPLAVVVSSVVASPVDTVLFLWLAGFPVTWQAVLGQFLVKTGMALLVAGVLKVRAR
jgi:queuosine precursor transporter